MTEQERLNEIMRKSRHEREEAWKRRFGKRLTMLLERAGATPLDAAVLAECSEERMNSIIRGEEFPTIPEVMRLCHLAYRADELLIDGRSE